MAARIRELRDISGYGKEEMAKMLKIDPALYAQYEENGENIPINVLFRISGILKVDLNEILTGTTPHLESYCLVKRGKGMEIDRYPGYRFNSLAYTYKHRVMEPLLVTVDASGGDTSLVTHGGQEFNFCLEGTMELLFDGKIIRLNEGDCVYFNPSHPHGQRAVGGRARFLTVITN
jgi:transcriptional regulator with XRE-family HTH domain